VDADRFPTEEFTLMTEHAALLPRYKRLRKVAIPLNNRLAKLPKDILDEGGKKLGILKGKTLVLDTEDEIVVLMDYCIYDVRRQGRNAVERYLAESRPAADSDEMLLLQAMRQARYALLLVEGVEPGVGVHVRDLLRDEPLFLTDVGFSSTAKPGLVMASRRMTVDGITMTTGAALPVGLLSPPKRAAFIELVKKTIKTSDLRNLSAEEASDMAAGIIRHCLRAGAAEHIYYEEPGSAGGRGRAPVSTRPAVPTPPRRIGRNDPCPCGSGRKFKHCCGGRR
jgi:hypothetical protein